MNRYILSDTCKNIYEIIKEEEVKDIHANGYLLRHKKSGARISYFQNDDENKVFSIAFRTPPEDSTGIAHIIEHSVLCGSKDFPVKDPFVELAKGSLNTFLNAMTYPDKTVYPVASCNKKDFANLMHVYLDAVFYPNMLEKKEVFEQEGWHYELQDEEDELTINGVVYNEMRGVFSSPDQQLSRMVQKALFPNTTYGNESGGDPDDIPKLTYKDFKAFHAKYYHPSNSFISLYGNMDIEERLIWMDEEYLSHFDQIDPDSEIALQKAFESPISMSEKYSAQSEEAKAYFSYNSVVDTALNKEFQLAFQILAYALVLVPGAPLKQVLSDAKIGEDISCSFDGDMIQPVFSIFAREADANKEEEFVELIQKTLAEICENGIDKKSLEAALAFYEFKNKEADFGRYPKGLMYILEAYKSWLYNEDEPFAPLNMNTVYKDLRAKIETRYYEDLIRKYLLENPHTAMVSVYPEVGLSAKKDLELQEELKNRKGSMTADEIMAIVDNTKNLTKYQESMDSPEDLAKIPLLRREDIDREAPRIYNEKKELSSIPVLHHNLKTNEIAYIDLSFDVTKYKEYLPYINILSFMLGNVDTVNYKYLELSNEINLNTGGISCNVSVSVKKGDVDQYKILFELGTRVLYQSMSRSLELLKEILRGSILNNKKRLKEILLEVRADLKSTMESSGNSTAVDRALSYLAEASFYQNQISGIAFYRMLDDICNSYDEHADALIELLEMLVYKVFEKENLLISFTADDEGFATFEEISYDLFEALYPSNEEELPSILPIYKPIMGKWNEGFKTPGKVQYVAQTGNFIRKGFEYSGGLKVLKTILNYDYLWLTVRIKGGAYGGMCGFTRNGNAYFVSYRDPNLKDTLLAYEGIPEFLSAFEADEREMTKYIIGTMSEQDMPLTPRARGRLAYNMYIAGVNQFDLQKEREEILDVTQEDIQQFRKLIREILGTHNICVIGSDAAIEANKKLFNNIENLS